MVELKRQLSVYVRNQPGELADICALFDQEEITIIGFTVADTVDHAVVRFLVDRPSRAQKVLENEGMLVVDNLVLTVRLDNNLNNIGAVAETLSEAGINIGYGYYSISSAGKSTGSLLVAKVSEPRRAQDVLLTGKKRLVAT